MWEDCKVAYSINDPDRFWRWVRKHGDKLPKGWEANETDCAGARCVAVFRVKGVPEKSDGIKVRRLLNHYRI